MIRFADGFAEAFDKESFVVDRFGGVVAVLFDRSSVKDFSKLAEVIGAVVRFAGVKEDVFGLEAEIDQIFTDGFSDGRVKHGEVTSRECELGFALLEHESANEEGIVGTGGEALFERTAETHAGWWSNVAGGEADMERCIVLGF